MKMRLLVILFCVGAGSLFSQQSVQSITVDGSQRSYIQYLPSNFNSSTEELPVVLILHGLGGTAQQMTTSGFNAIADTARFIPIYPQGSLNGFGQASWNNGTMLASSTNDVHFLDTLIQDFKSNYNTDLSRTYICGLSAGGVMSYRMALKKPEKIAAMASMAGTMSSEDLDNFSNTVLNMPVMHWHGTDDQVVPYDNNAVASITFVPETINFWKSKNSCNSLDSTVISIPDNVNDGITVQRVIYEDCFIDDEVELWIFNGGEHTWFAEPNNDTDGAKEFWKFFSKFENSDDNLSALKDKLQLKIYPNPTTNFIKVESSETVEQLEILNLQGASIRVIQYPSDKIDLSNLQSGCYYIKVKTSKGSFVKKFLINH